MAHAWGESIDDRKRQQAAWAFIKAAVDEYVRELCHTTFNMGLIDSWCKTETQAFGTHLITHRKSP